MSSVSASRSPSLFSLLFLSSLLLVSQIHASSQSVTLPFLDGLSYNYYLLTCPLIERIVRKHLEDVFQKDSGQAPGILRLFFHDCFAQGCDASILLNGVGQDDEKQNFANIGLRPEAIQTIENIRQIVARQCLRVVSCADILVLAAREAVRQSGGPDFDVRLGRKDSLTFNVSAPNNLPAPFARTSDLLKKFGDRKFDTTDVVALSGAHTFGRAHCPSLVNRTIEDNPPIDPDFKNKLKATCPSNANPDITVDLDNITPTKFDNKYYINLLNKQGVFTSDQDIAQDPRTKDIVRSFANNQKLFFDKFANAFVKVSQLGVLTGFEGEIRKTCFATNKGNELHGIKSVVEMPEMF
ncbi:unnamed protein product [Lupinus luteus]|uniref:Peroxidase n=1 Tax=Lupinus luteus TaxID=3873 RepID=A0AAV1W1X9_LUPLU